ncbi:cytochrome P450 [Colletotrichum zoysiae]|uniref:Cytochrome P450 n=1 Tax=Colletotrichum zoysiae TaxID=1216348 RepID=A0AAD9H8B7_9PEZI|nr:cytochrome P450 [Colletotrichum zoysiae]
MTITLPYNLLSEGMLTGYVGLLVAFSLSLCLLYYLALPKPLPGIPYEKAAAKNVFGHMKEMMDFKKLHDNRMVPWFHEHQRRVGSPLTQFFPAPFAKPVLILSDFWEVQDLELHRRRDFGRGARDISLFKHTTPEFLAGLDPNDPRHKPNKALVKDTMSPVFLEKVTGPRVYACALDLVDLWKFKLAAARHRPFDAEEDIFSAVSDIITAALYDLSPDMGHTRQQLRHLKSLGEDLRIEHNEHGGLVFPELPPLPHYEHFQLFLDHQGDILKSPLPSLLHYYKMLVSSELREAYRGVKHFESREIDKSVMRLEGGEPITCVVDNMVRQEQRAAAGENRKPVYHRPAFLDNLSGYYSAGHETSASALSWAIKFLSIHQESQERLRIALHKTHAAALTEGRNPTLEEIVRANNHYLNAVIEEALRMRPPFSFGSRSSHIDTTLLGYRVPKDTTIIITFMGPSLLSPAMPIPEELRSESCQKNGRPAWPDEDIHLFKPERWLKTNEAGETVYDSLAGPMQTFGFGTLQCFGKRLAYLQIRTVLTLLVWNFKFAEIEGILSSDAGVELSTLRPKYSYVKLEEV